MIKLVEIIESPQSITIDDVMDIVSNSRAKWAFRDSLSLLRTLEQFYYSDKPEEKGWADDYLNLLNKVMAYGIEIANHLKIPYVDTNFFKTYLLDQSEFKIKPEEFFPFPLYIAATKNSDGDWATIGILVDYNGKAIEIHEGNDEASSETIALANKLINPSGKQVRIYGMHGTEICRKIEISGYLPPNLYVSPDRGHASRHWDNTDRSMFTGIVDINDLSQESDLDWKSVGNTKIEKFRWL